MRYRQILHIISKSLSLEVYPERAKEVAALIEALDPDWEDLVRVSSGMLVLPAFYLNLQRHDLLHLLPEELSTYLDLLTKKNRERNLALLEQADEIEDVLGKAGIGFFFLKGMAKLKLGLYKDAAERMMGDIDLLVENAQMEDAVNILLNIGYSKSVAYNKYIHAQGHHYPRLLNLKKGGGVDVHSHLVRFPYHDELPFDELFNTQQLNENGNPVHIPSYEHMLIHNILNVQVHDRAQYYGDIHLRHLYDFLLLRSFVNPREVIQKYERFRSVSEKYILLAEYLFDQDGRVNLRRKGSRSVFIRRSLFLSNRNSVLSRLGRYCLFLLYRIVRNIGMFGRAMLNRDVRRGISLRLKDASWYRKHFKSYRNSK